MNRMKIDKSYLIKKILPVFVGAVIGYAYYYFIGCKSGSCPISGNPWIATIYGAGAGFLVFFPSKKKADDNSAN
jgi:hypothetical protein